MYLKTPGSIKYDIKGLYTVWLPPIPDKEQILFSSYRKDYQFWRRTPLPNFYDERRGEEMYRQQLEKKLVDEGAIPRVKHFDPVLEQYRRQEWLRRIYGVYFMNNGVPTYLTGTNYLYLQWCKLDHDENDGYPLFYRPMLDRFYFRQLCKEDPFTHGYIIVGPRGFGKSSEEVAAMLDNMTVGHNKHGAIQSKNKEEAEEVLFQKKMVPMFNSWPDFFKPEFSHGTDPKTQMVFRRPTVLGKKAKHVKHGPDLELSNDIVTAAPSNRALDSMTLSDIINDEIGKLKPEKDQDAYTRHATNLKSIFRNQVKRGLIRATTTIEEMDQGGEECHEIWLESDPRQRDQNGFTISKLYKLFISALDTQTDLADKFGHIPEEEAYKKITNEREPVKDDNYKLSLLMRKNPLTEEEAFIRPQGDCIYDIMIISKRLSELKQMKPRPGRRFFPEWVNGVVDGDVELIENSEGPVTLFYTPDEWWSKERKLLNACKFYKNDDGKKLWLPCNNDLFRSSADPIKFVKTDDPRASKFAAHGMMKFIPDLDNGKEDIRDWLSFNIMWEYHNRFTDPELDYENIIKLMRYFGHSIMPEPNAGEFYKHLLSRGYERFIIMRKNFDASVLHSKFSKNSLSGDNPVHNAVEVTESYIKRTAAMIRRHGMRINSIPLLEQLGSFDPKHPTKFDLAVSYGYGILALEADLEDDYYQVEKQLQMVMSLFDQYDISGNQSRMIQPTTSNLGEDEEEGYSEFDDPNYILNIMSGR